MSQNPRSFVVMVTYEIWERDHEVYLELMERVRENALDMGAISYQLLVDDDQPTRFTEIMSFDTWNHYKRVQAKDLAPGMSEVYARIADITIGGEADTDVRYLNLLAG
jgi:hypothetical protein